MSALTLAQADHARDLIHHFPPRILAEKTLLLFPASIMINR